MSPRRRGARVCHCGRVYAENFGVAVDARVDECLGGCITTHSDHDYYLSTPLFPSPLRPNLTSSSPSRSQPQNHCQLQPQTHPYPYPDPPIGLLPQVAILIIAVGMGEVGDRFERATEVVSDGKGDHLTAVVETAHAYMGMSMCMSCIGGCLYMNG